MLTYSIFTPPKGPHYELLDRYLEMKYNALDGVEEDL